MSKKLLHRKAVILITIIFLCVLKTVSSFLLNKAECLYLPTTKTIRARAVNRPKTRLVALSLLPNQPVSQQALLKNR